MSIDEIISAYGIPGKNFTIININDLGNPKIKEIEKYVSRNNTTLHIIYINEDDPEKSRIDSYHALNGDGIKGTSKNLSNLPVEEKREWRKYLRKLGISLNSEGMYQ